MSAAIYPCEDTCIVGKKGVEVNVHCRACRGFEAKHFAFNISTVRVNFDVEEDPVPSQCSKKSATF